MTAPGQNQWRYVLNGFANGILILAVCAASWLMGAVYSAVCAQAGLDPLGATDVDLPASWLLLNLLLAGVLIAGSVKVRRLSRRFKTLEPSSPGAEQRQYRRLIRRRFVQIALAEWILVAAVILLGIHFHRRDLIWPGVSLVICLHFAPLASLFRLQSYHVLAIAGSLFSSVALVVPRASMNTAYRLFLVSAGVGAAMWVTAAYNIVLAHRLARKVG